ncbi:MAG TPA: hypothetical protein VFG01_09520, partial [Acidobacteriota bacterium]|nr:hypothetical protein [Acidobacteriota bacterium]
LCHILICLLTNAQIQNYNLITRYKSKRTDTGDKVKYEYGGSVSVNTEQRFTFLQALLIAFAPLYIGFWIFFFLLDLFLHTSLNMISFFIVIFLMSSLIFGAGPSLQDLKTIGLAFQKDTIYSLYQIVLVAISVFILWGGILFFDWTFIHEIFLYISLGITYYILRFSSRGISYLYQTIVAKNRVNHYEVRSRDLYRSRIRPKKRKKQKIERGQW